MNMDEIIIRDIQADAADLEQLIEIENLSFSQADAWLDKDFKHWLNTNPDFCIAAEIDGRIIGSIFGRIQRYRLNIGSCAIHPDHRRGGVAAALLAELEKRAKAFSIHQIDLEVRPSNQDGQAFWQSMGFEQFKVLSGFYLDGEDALLMNKKLG
jgi:ribosomal-protein-alanine N-acetyltransferase